MCDIEECIDTYEIKTFDNNKRKYFIEMILSDINNKFINKLLSGDNILEILHESNIINDIKMYYNETTKLVEYINIDNNENIIFVGDIHGDLNAMINAFSLFDNNSHIVFLGDIVDRGPNSLECIVFLYLYKMLYPKRVHIIRGNHECASVSRFYGFYGEILKKCIGGEVDNIYDNICQTFSHLPIVCIIKNKKNMYRICCVHGCVDQNTNLTIIEYGNHAKENFTHECWNDPHPECVYNKLVEDEPSARGIGTYVSHNSILEWMKKNYINCIIRSHEVIEKGFFLPFGEKTHLIHIFSQPNYCNITDNKASFAIINDAFTKCTFYVFDHNYENKINLNAIYDLKYF